MIVGIHIMDILELLRDRFLTTLTKQFHALLYVVVFYQHHPHDVGIDIFFCHSWGLICILFKVHINNPLLNLGACSRVTSILQEITLVRISKINDLRL